jgi:alpha-galactosidase
MGTATLYSEETQNLNLNILKTEISTPGKGDYRTPSTVISYNEGMTTLDFIYNRHQISKGKTTSTELPSSYATPQTCQTLQITMNDKELPIRLVLSYSVFEDSDVISRKTTVYNDSKSIITIQSIASMQIDLDDNDYDLITFDGAWARERHITRRPLSVGTIINDTRMGVSSASHNPCIYLARKDCTEIAGECIATNLIYSGNHKESIEVNDFNQTRILTGINDQTFNWSLHPGEYFDSPEAISTYSLQGLSGASRNFHYFAAKTTIFVNLSQTK